MLLLALGMTLIVLIMAAVLLPVIKATLGMPAAAAICVLLTILVGIVVTWAYEEKR